MQDWDYNELTEYIVEVFENSINDGLNALQAGGRCLYEFANVIEDGSTEKTIVYVTLASLQIEKEVLSQRVYEEIKIITNSFELSNFVNELGFDDANALNEQVKKVVAELHNIEIIG